MMADLTQYNRSLPITDVRASARLPALTQRHIDPPRCHACFERGHLMDKPTMTKVTLLP